MSGSDAFGISNSMEFRHFKNEFNFDKFLNIRLQFSTVQEID